MTAQQEDELIGSMMKERKALRGRLTLLHEGAGRLGKHLMSLGERMVGKVAYHSDLKPEQVDALDAEKIITLLKEIREASTRLKELDEKLKEFD